MQIWNYWTKIQHTPLQNLLEHYVDRAIVIKHEKKDSGRKIESIIGKCQLNICTSLIIRSHVMLSVKQTL